MTGWRSQLRRASPDIVGRALKRGGGIAKRGMGQALKKGGRVGKQTGGRTNLLEELGRVEAKPSNRNRRAEVRRVHHELNKGLRGGGIAKKGKGVAL